MVVSGEPETEAKVVEFKVEQKNAEVDKSTDVHTEQEVIESKVEQNEAKDGPFHENVRVYTSRGVETRDLNADEYKHLLTQGCLGIAPPWANKLLDQMSDE